MFAGLPLSVTVTVNANTRDCGGARDQAGCRIERKSSRQVAARDRPGQCAYAAGRRNRRGIRSVLERVQVCSGSDLQSARRC